MSGMLRWVENKQESNQSAINTATLQTCWDFVQSSNLPIDSWAVAAKSNSPFVPVSMRWDKEGKKALIRKQSRTEGGKLSYSSVMTP